MGIPRVRNPLFFLWNFFIFENKSNFFEENSQKGLKNQNTILIKNFMSIFNNDLGKSDRIKVKIPKITKLIILYNISKDQ